MFRRMLPVALVAGLAVGCGTSPAATGNLATPKVATKTAKNSATKTATATAPVAAEDLSFLDLASYAKLARLYVSWSLFLMQAQLDYVGCRWLDDNGFVISGTAGWTFGYFHRPENGQPRSAYAVVNVDQKHAASKGKEADVLHRGIAPLYLESMPSPRQSIQAALKQDLPQGDRYAVEYLSASPEAPSLAVITSFRGDRRQGYTTLEVR